jgi:hypothetical protein
LIKLSMLAVIRKLWRYKFVTLPIIVLALAAAVYTVAFKPPLYQANVEYLLFSPPSLPEDTTDPAILRAADNPYTRVGDMTVIAQLMSTRLSSSEARLSLAAQGADPAYLVAPGGGFGYSTPTIEITGNGPTAQSAVKTANLVGAALTRQLNQMQKARGVGARYRITVQAVVPARHATLRPSGTLRGLFGVIAGAGVVLFFVVSVLEAIAAIRRGDDDDRRVPQYHSVPDYPPAPDYHHVHDLHPVPHALDGVGRQPAPRHHAPAPPSGGPRWDSGGVDHAPAPTSGKYPSRRRHIDDGRVA